MKVLLVAGARPNFMKIAPIYRESLNYPEVQCLIVHTGQHYDHAMSQAFFDDLEIPAPDYSLDAGSGSHAKQTASIMIAFEEVCRIEQPDLIIVVGDVNSTLACTIVGKKLCIKVAHVEAGLRSGDIRMPEEINRLVTDSICDLFFVTEESALQHLLREGKDPDQIHFVGHVMIDNLLQQVARLERVDTESFPVAQLKRKHRSYAFLTLHRPSNVDDPDTLRGLLQALEEISDELPILFPAHPRTSKKLAEFGLTLPERIVQLPPLGFQESLFLWKDARVVLTDSGGLQEETTALGVPCITLRDSTERPVTATCGTNILAGTEPADILAAYRRALAMKPGQNRVPPLWDGLAAVRIWRELMFCQPRCKFPVEEQIPA